MICFSNKCWHIKKFSGGRKQSSQHRATSTGGSAWLKLYHSNIYSFFCRAVSCSHSFNCMRLCVLQVLVRWSNVVLVNMQGYSSDLTKLIVLLIYVFILWKRIAFLMFFRALHFYFSLILWRLQFLDKVLHHLFIVNYIFWPFTKFGCVQCRWWFYGCVY